MIPEVPCGLNRRRRELTSNGDGSNSGSGEGRALSTEITVSTCQEACRAYL